MERKIKKGRLGKNGSKRKRDSEKLLGLTGKVLGGSQPVAVLYRHE